MRYQFDHIGIQVVSIEQVLHFLQASQYQIIDAPEVGLKIALLELNGTKIEFLEILSRENPLLKQLNYEINHMGFRVDNIESIYQTFAKDSQIILETPIIVGLHQKKVFFYRVQNHGSALYEFMSD